MPKPRDDVEILSSFLRAFVKVKLVRCVLGQGLGYRLVSGTYCLKLRHDIFASHPF